MTRTTNQATAAIAGSPSLAGWGATLGDGTGHFGLVLNGLTVEVANDGVTFAINCSHDNAARGIAGALLEADKAGALARQLLQAADAVDGTGT